VPVVVMVVMTVAAVIVAVLMAVVVMAVIVAMVMAMVMAVASVRGRGEYTAEGQGSHSNQGVEERLHRNLLRNFGSQGGRATCCGNGTTKMQPECQETTESPQVIQQKSLIAFASFFQAVPNSQK
jgi:MFS superfamily sulfate permease-like transporter